MLFQFWCIFLTFWEADSCRYIKYLLCHLLTTPLYEYTKNKDLVLLLMGIWNIIATFVPKSCAHVYTTY